MKNLKKTLKNILLLSVFVSASSSALEFSLKVRPYVGVDAQWKHMDFEPGAGQNIFRKNLLQGNGYLGFDINDYFGLEAGFESTVQKTKTATFYPGDDVLGFVLFPGDPVEGHTFKNKLSGWHLNFLVFSPWVLENNSLRFFASVGFSHKRLLLIDEVLTENGAPIVSNIVDQLRKTFTARKTLSRLALGAQKMLNENWGVRSSFSWENTNKFRYLKSKESPDGITTASAKNSIALGLGVLYKF
jgi:hypothetical protein